MQNAKCKIPLRRGATLIELVILLGIIAITAGLTTATYLSLQKRNIVDNAINDLMGDLREAQQNAVSQKEGSAWGTYLDSPSSGQSYYKVFYGNSYSTGTTTKTVALSTKLKFTDPAVGATKELVFSKMTGLLSAGAAATTTISLSSDSSIYRVININIQGLIYLLP